MCLLDCGVEGRWILLDARDYSKLQLGFGKWGHARCSCSRSEFLKPATSNTGSRELLVFWGVGRQGLSVYYGMFTSIPDFHEMPEVPLPLVMTTKMIFRDFKRRCLLEAPSCPCGESLQIITLTNDLFYWHM